MIQYIQYKYRRRLSNWLLGVEGTSTEHKIVHYHPKTIELTSQHEYDLYEMDEYKDRLHSQITKKIVTDLVHQAIQSGFVKIIQGDDPMHRKGFIRAELKVIETVE